MAGTWAKQQRYTEALEAFDAQTDLPLALVAGAWRAHFVQVLQTVSAGRILLESDLEEPEVLIPSTRKALYFWGEGSCTACTVCSALGANLKERRGDLLRMAALIARARGWSLDEALDITAVNAHRFYSLTGQVDTANKNGNRRPRPSELGHPR